MQRLEAISTNRNSLTGVLLTGLVISISFCSSGGFAIRVGCLCTEIGEEPFRYILPPPSAAALSPDDGGKLCRRNIEVVVDDQVIVLHIVGDFVRGDA